MDKVKQDSVYSAHSYRVAAYMCAMHRVLAKYGYFSQKDPGFNYLMAGLYHDVGKDDIPNEILLKQEPLTESEWDLMKKHPQFGLARYDMLYASTAAPKCSAKIVRETILNHHERWDGKGYPSGLSGAAIPLSARVCAIADTFDAITNDRPYQKRRTVGEAISIIQKAAGTQFDAVIANILLAHTDEWGIPSVKNMKPNRWWQHTGEQTACVSPKNT